MKVALVGATGGTGRHVVPMALEAGHEVTALVRHPERLGSWRDRVQIVVGDVLNPDPVHRTVAGAEAVVSLLGYTRGNPKNVRSAGTAHLLSAMAGHRVRRLVAVTSLGAGDSRRQLPPLFRFMVATVLREIVADTNRQEDLIRGTDLDWTILRPGRLVDGGPTGRYLMGTDPTLTARTVTRGEVADAVVREITSTDHLRQAVAVT